MNGPWASPARSHQQLDQRSSIAMPKHLSTAPPTPTNGRSYRLGGDQPRPPRKPTKPKKNPAAFALGRFGGRKGGRTRAIA